jgi:hypothetical protein
MPRRTVTPEGAILKGAVALLRARPDVVGLYWRNNVGALRDATGRLVRFGVVGASDLIGAIRPIGRLIALECKVPGRKPTAAQRAYLQAVRDAGGVAVVIDDLSTLARVLDRLAADPLARLDLDGEPIR